MSKQTGDKGKWNQRYQTSAESHPAAMVLSENAHLLPEEGNALDLACGFGANAVFLAQKGLTTYAWDLSDVAIKKLQVFSQSLFLDIKTEVRDVVKNPPRENSFDVIVVSRFLDRTIIQNLIDALNNDGLIFYQTFIVDKVANVGPSNPEYLLKTNELLQLFQSLTVRVYGEEGKVGNLRKGFRNEAMLVAQKSVA